MDVWRYNDASQYGGTEEGYATLVFTCGNPPEICNVLPRAPCNTASVHLAPGYHVKKVVPLQFIPSRSRVSPTNNQPWSTAQIPKEVASGISLALRSLSDWILRRASAHYRRYECLICLGLRRNYPRMVIADSSISTTYRKNL